VKIASVGLPDFPVGKKNLADERLNILEEIMKPSKTTFITVELLDSAGLKDADAIICENESKLDLIISDLEAVESRLLRATEEAEIKLFNRLKDILEKNKCLCEETFTEDEKKILLNSNLVSAKPVYFVDKNDVKPAQEIIFNAYYAAGMICFITGAKDKELKAWQIKKGTIALEAAGAIHSDIKRGFIKVEIISYNDLVKAGSLIGAKHFMHLEGKEYIMQDADTVNFRFNV